MFGSSHCYYDQTEGGFAGGVSVPVIMIGPSSRSKGGLAAGGRDWEAGDVGAKHALQSLSHWWVV